MLIFWLYSKTYKLLRIRDVYLDVAVDGGSGKLASSIEVCRCPPGYSGFSCEKCVQGYWRYLTTMH